MANATIQKPGASSAKAAEDFTNLIDQAYGKVFDMAYRLSHNRQDAEDLTQEACFRAFRSFDRFEGDRPFTNWMYRIVTRLYLDQLRLRGRRAQEVSLDSSFSSENEGLPLFEPADTRPTPEEELLNKTIDEKLLWAMDFLTPQQRELVRLVDLDGVDAQETAQKTSIPPSTVRSTLFRAHRQMRSRLNSQRVSGVSTSRKHDPVSRPIYGPGWQTTSISDLANRLAAEED